MSKRLYAVVDVKRPRFQEKLMNSLCFSINVREQKLIFNQSFIYLTTPQLHKVIYVQIILLKIIGVAYTREVITIGK